MSNRVIKGKILNKESDESNHSNYHENSCFCSESEDKYIDEDLEELINSDMKSVINELGSYGRDVDSILERLFIDLDPDVIKLIASREKEKKFQFNYFLEALSLIQEAVLESFYTTRKQSFWQRQPVFSATAGILLFGTATFLVGFLWSGGGNGDETINQDEFLVKAFDPSNSSSDSEDVVDLTITTIKNDEGKDTPSNESADKTVTTTTQISEIMTELSHSEKENLSKKAYSYLLDGGKLEPTEKMNLFLKELTENSLFNEANLIKTALSYKSSICSNSGFYSYIIEEGDTLFSISHRCGFKYKDFNEAQGIPTLNKSDVVHFNFDQSYTLTKVTIYKNDDFHILDFDQGIFLKKEILGKENSITVEVDLQKNINIHDGLKNSDDLKDKGDLWMKVVDNLSKSYHHRLTTSKAKKGMKYYVSIKYRHNKITDHYEVNATSLFIDRYGN